MVLTLPKLIGILNCTPDSFYDGSPQKIEDWVYKGCQLVREGALVVDVGGESTRSGAHPVSADEELSRVIPVIKKLSSLISVPLSIDTTKAIVACEALKAGAQIVNDVSGLRADPLMLQVIHDFNAYVIVMHSRGTSQNMDQLAVYRQVVDEVLSELQSIVCGLLEQGISQEKIMLDPGFGFAKSVEQNQELFKNLEQFVALGFPVVCGFSRKRFIGALSEALTPQERLPGSLAASILAMQKGIHYLRVHDVLSTRQALMTYAALSTNKRSQVNFGVKTV